MLDLLVACRNMYTETQRLPDLAGRGNLLFDGNGTLFLVDPNDPTRGISPIKYKRREPVHHIPVTQQGFPVFDASLHVLSEIARLGGLCTENDALFAPMRDPIRQRALKQIYRALEAQRANAAMMGLSI